MNKKIGLPPKKERLENFVVFFNQECGFIGFGRSFYLLILIGGEFLKTKKPG